MTLVVRDEEDVLAANLDYHLAQGIDVILVVDHGSSDGTPEILEQYAAGNRVRWFREEDRAHDQVRRVNRLLRIATEEHDANWVIHCDADEFWIPAAGCLRDVFAAVPERYGYLVVERNNFIPVADDDRPFYERMLIREARSLNLRGMRLEPKVAQRPAAADSVEPGNHALEGPVMAGAPDIGALEIFHFPLRTFEQFEQKVIKVGVGYEQLEERDPSTGCDQLELLAWQRSGRLADYYAEQQRDPTAIEEACREGELVVDERLADAMASGPGIVPESPPAQVFLRRAWQHAGAQEEAAREREESAREREERLRVQLCELDEAIHRLSTERDDLLDTLQAIRSSRIMRMTAPARRAYYRVREANGSAHAAGAVGGDQA